MLSSRSGCLLRNIHISNINGFFFFLHRLFSLLYHWLLSNLTIYMWVTRRVFYKKQEPAFSRIFDGIRVTHLFSFLCCVVFLCCVSVLCFCFFVFLVFILFFVRPMLSVSLDCPFLIALHLSLTFIPYIDKISTFPCFFIEKKTTLSGQSQNPIHKS
jgi:hypothetical protein